MLVLELGKVLVHRLDMLNLVKKVSLALIGMRLRRLILHTSRLINEAHVLRGWAFCLLLEYIPYDSLFWTRFESTRELSCRISALIVSLLLVHDG